MINVAKELHKCLPGIGFVSWDFAINEKNQVVLIEGNIQCGGILMLQNAHVKRVFGSDILYMLNLLKIRKKLSVDKTISWEGVYKSEKD